MQPLEGRHPLGVPDARGIPCERQAAGLEVAGDPAFLVRPLAVELGPQRDLQGPAREPRGLARAKKSSSSLVGSLLPITRTRGRAPMSLPEADAGQQSANRSFETRGAPAVPLLHWNSNGRPPTSRTARRARSPGHRPKRPKLSSRKPAHPSLRGVADRKPMNTRARLSPTRNREARPVRRCGLLRIQRATFPGTRAALPVRGSITRLGRRTISTPVVSPAFCPQHADPRANVISARATWATRQSSRSRTENANGAAKRLVA